MIESESDAALWLAAKSGTERAFVALFDRHRARIFRAALRRTENVTDAEDAVAIVFLEAWRLRDRVRIVDGSLLPWLLTVAGHVCSNLTRAQRRYSRLLARLPASEASDDFSAEVGERLDRVARSTAIDQAMRSLRRGDRLVVELCLLEELSMAEAAAALDLPVGTVKSRLNRARRQLRTELLASDITWEKLFKIPSRRGEPS